ncbi:MAG: hypothetical protein KC421_06520, partial [Anaerolineales bacterium]|nr:hypothetical protein [Anaerolineales bacterium]
MREHFSGFYPKNQVDISKIWAESIFVLDANVLLNMYRYSESVKENLLQVLSTISERLWIPHQAALEYQQNRLTVISEQLKKFSDVKKIINDMENGVQNSF